MKVKQLVVFFTVFLSVSLPLFAGGGKEPGKGQTEKVTLRVGTLKGPTGIGLIKVMEDGPELSDSVRAEFEVTGSPEVLVSRVLSGEVDIATLPSNLTANLYNKGVPYSLGAVTGYGLIYLLSSDPEIDSFGDLKGEVVYNAGQGATPDFLLRYLLTENGIDPVNEVEVRFTYGHAELAQLLIAGKVETALLPEPFVTMAVSKSGDVRIAADLQQEWARVRGTHSNYPISAVLVKNETLERHREAVAVFFNAYRESIQWVKDNAEEAGPLSVKHDIGLPPAIAAQSVPRLNLTFISAVDSRPMMERFLQVFLDFDPESIGGRLPDDDFYADW